MKTPKVFENIPSMSDLLESPPLKSLVDRANRSSVVSGVRTFLDEMRSEVDKKAADWKVPPLSELAERIAKRILQGELPALRPVINATGILLHPQLGPAPLADEALEEMLAISRDYASVEYSLATGRDAPRMDAVRRLLCKLSGGEDALVVNNHAGATLLALAALAQGREVIVSRGHLGEIEANYRLPDALAASGAILREVGTTNRTTAEDFAESVGSMTAALLHVHTSNFQLVGSVEQPELESLVAIGKEHELPVVSNVVSGDLRDGDLHGIAGTTSVAKSLELGADVALFCGNKLLGGPECGIIVGHAKRIEPIANHPLAQALAVDKGRLAALAATLRLYGDPQKTAQFIPLLQLLTTPLENLRNRAERLAPQMDVAPAIATAEPFESHTFLAGDEVPNQQISTWCIALTPKNGDAQQLAAALRRGLPPVVAKVSDDRVVLDLRAVLPRQDVDLIQAVAALA